VTRVDLLEELIATKAMPIARALKTPDGEVLLEVLREGVDELRGQVGKPIDPYALAMAEGAQRLIDKLTTFRDAADKTRSTKNG
jgi:hypothetical protein